MSHADSVSLRVEVAELREEVESLRVEVGRLRRSLSELRLIVQGVGEVDRVSESSFAVVAEQREIPVAPLPLAETGGAGRAASSCGLSWGERESIAEQIGGYLVRSLAGNHRGSSGRDRIPLASRFYIIVRDFTGHVFSPVKVVRSWSSCQRLVKRGSDIGESIFVGVPSEREAQKVVSSAGLTFPQVIEP